MPRTPWRRRRTTDSPRPAGRRWAGRLRRSGTLARQALLVRVGRRSGESGRAATATRAEVIYTGHRALEPRPARSGAGRHTWRRPRSRPPSSRPGASRCCPASTPRPAGSASPWSTRARWPAWRSACSRSSWPCRATSGSRPAAWSPAWPSTASTARWPASSACPARSAPRWTRWPTCARSAWPRPVVVYASLAHTVPTAGRRGGLRAGRRLRRDPAGPVQRLAEGRQVLLRRAHHDGGRGAGR